MHDLFAVLGRKGRKKEKGRDVSLSLLVSWFLRSRVFISAGLSVWVGRYESWFVFSWCNVRGKFRSVLPGPAHILHPRSPAKLLHTSIRENPQLSVPLEQVRELTVTSDDCHVATGRPPAPGACFAYNRSTSRNK